MTFQKSIFKAICLPFAVVVTLGVAASYLSPVAMAQGPAEPAADGYQTFFSPKLQRFVNMELVNNRGERNSMRFLVQGICKGTKPLKTAQVDNTQAFDDFFMKYYFPMMTHPDELGNVAEMRLDLMKRYFGGIKNDANGQAVRDRLNALTLKFMHGIIGTRLGVFHPAVRYNAMLIIGDLDSRGAELFGDPRPAAPLLAALDVMRAELASKDQIDAVRIAALVGIARHAELDRHRPADSRIPEAAVRPLVENLVPLAGAKEPPANRTPAGHTWMRRQAIEILGSLAATRPTGPVEQLVPIIDSILADPKEPLVLKCAAADAVGKMRRPVAEGVPPEKTAANLMLLAHDILDAELNQLQPFMDELEQDNAADFGGRFDGGFDGGGGGFDIIDRGDGEEGELTVIEKAPEVLMLQRRGRHHLQSIEHGLFGFEGGPGVVVGVRDAEVKTNATNLKTTLDQVQEILATQAPLGKKPTLAEVETFYTTLDEQRRALAELSPKPAEEPVDLGPDLDGPAEEPPVAATPSEPAELPALP